MATKTNNIEKTSFQEKTRNIVQVTNNNSFHNKASWHTRTHTHFLRLAGANEGPPPLSPKWTCECAKKGLRLSLCSARGWVICTSATHTQKLASIREGVAWHAHVSTACHSIPPHGAQWHGTAQPTMAQHESKSTARHGTGHPTRWQGWAKPSGYKQLGTSRWRWPEANQLCAEPI